MRRAVAAAAAALALLAGSCSEVYPYYCEDSDQCYLDGVDGVCTPYFMCAFPDATCDAAPHLRYHPDTELGGVCVGDEEELD